MSQIAVYLNNERAELFKKFCQFEKQWERLFNDDFTGNLTIHCRQGELQRFDWLEIEKLSTEEKNLTNKK